MLSEAALAEIEKWQAWLRSHVMGKKRHGKSVEGMLLFDAVPALVADVRALRGELLAARAALEGAQLSEHRMLEFSLAQFKRWLPTHNEAIHAALARIDTVLGEQE